MLWGRLGLSESGSIELSSTRCGGLLSDTYGQSYSNEHSVIDMDEIVLLFIKTIELIFDLVETIYRRFFADEIDDDKQAQSGIDDVQ